MQHACDNWFVAFFEGALVLLIMVRIVKSMRGSIPFIRRIPGLNAIDEAIGRATEMGKPILMIPGILGLDIVSLQALNVFTHVTRTAARFATPIRMCVCDATLYTISQEVIQDAYQAEGKPELYDPDSVRFLSDQQFAFAASVAGLIQREQVAATFFLGSFFAESLIFAEVANSVGAIQVAGTVMTTQTPFFIAACDYVIIGDEFYAASAYLSKEPVATGSLVGQDYAKLLLTFFIVLGSIIYTVTGYAGGPQVPLIHELFADGGWTALLHSIRHLF
jgi:hypothetical protein